MLAVVAIAIALGRASKGKPSPEVKSAPFQSGTPSASEPIPEEPAFGPLRAPDSGLPCDVDEVLAKKCRRCHATPARHGAPFALYTWADTQRLRADQPLYRHIARVVQTGFMPYPIPANPPVLPLTDAEKQTLLDWVKAGAPRGACDLP